MSTFKEIRAKIKTLPEKVKQQAPHVIAETATEYYRNAFREKGWNGTAWPNAQRDPGNGSLMVRSGELQASIRPSKITTREVVISGGSPTVPYAQIHNEGGTVKQIPTPKQRKFFWAMEKGANPEGAKLGGWGRMAIAKELTINIPQRKFMGNSTILNRKIKERLMLLINK